MHLVSPAAQGMVNPLQRFARWAVVLRRWRGPGQVAHALDREWSYLFRPELIANRGADDPSLVKPGV
jgi:hypothetical protein